MPDEPVPPETPPGTDGRDESLTEVVKRAIFEAAELREIEERVEALRKRYSTILPPPRPPEEPDAPLP